MTARLRAVGPAPAAEWVRQGESGGVAGLRAARWLAMHVPDLLTGPIIWLIALVYSLPSGRPANAASIAYLRRALGRAPTLRDRRRHALAFARMAFERVQLLAGGFDGFRVETRGEDLVADLHSRGRGCVLLGAHFGSFEVMRAFDRSLPGLRVRYLMHNSHAPAMTRLLDPLNNEVAARVIPLDDGPQAMLSVFGALQEGDFVAFLGDRMPAEGAGACAEVNFLGGTMLLPTSPYLTAMTAKTPILMCFGPRLGRRRYEISFIELFDGHAVPRADRARVAAELAQRYATTLENLCRSDPCSWFNFFDVWSAGRGRDDGARRDIPLRRRNAA